MHRILTIALSAVTALTVAADSHIDWINTVHDFGAFDEDTKAKQATFRFVNTGDEPVTIITATATCGCTTPRYDIGAVAPGDTAAIEVSYDPTGRPGRFDKQVYVRTTAGPERVKLSIRGTVIGAPATIGARYPMSVGPLKLSGGAVMMGRVKAGQPKLAYIDGYNQSTDTLRPVVTRAPSYIDIKFVPAVVAPGDMLSMDVYYRDDDGTPAMWGMVNDSVSIAPYPGADATTIPLVMVVEENFDNLTPEQRADAPVASIDSNRLILTNIGSKPITGHVRLTNRGNSPLLVRRLYSADDGVRVSIDRDKVPHGQSADITVTYDPTAQTSDVVNSRVTLITNDPDNPTQTIRIVGER